ncbi:response regulator, partial [Alsobacter sp. SYSU M60028]
GARRERQRVGRADGFLARLPIDHVTAVPRRADAAALGRAARLAYDCVAAGEDAPPPTPARAARPLSLLVAEDNATNRIVIKAILEGAGHAVELVEDGEAALDALAERAFDVVIMDVNMPGMNGLEAARLYRVQALGGRAAPIIGLTADASEEMQRKCRAAGMAAYASKPVSAGHLVALIDEVASGRDSVARPAKPTPTPPSDALREDRARELERLGGAGFADGLSRQFVGQAEEGLAALRRAFERGDLDAFRRHAHHLKSAAGAVGADQVAWRCDRFQDLDRDAFARLSATELDALGREIDAYRGRAERRFARAPAATPG